MSTLASGKIALLYILLGLPPTPDDGKAPESAQTPVVESSAPAAVSNAKGAPMKSGKRDIAPFTALRINGAGNVMIFGQAPRSLGILAEEACMARIPAEVQGDTLGITRRPGRITKRGAGPARPAGNKRSE